jgi:hypothetical protein
MTGKQELGTNAQSRSVEVPLGFCVQGEALAGANEALASLGIKVPDGVNIKFIEDTATMVASRDATHLNPAQQCVLDTDAETRVSFGPDSAREIDAIIAE